MSNVCRRVVGWGTVPAVMLARQTLSVTTYTAIVLPGIAQHASYFPAAGTASTVLVRRHDCIVVINLTGLSTDEATAVAKAAGN